MGMAQYTQVVVRGNLEKDFLGIGLLTKNGLRQGEKLELLSCCLR
jgi:hypothetical protein